MAESVDTRSYAGLSRRDIPFVVIVALALILLAPPEVISPYYSVFTASVALVVATGAAAWALRRDAVRVAVPTALGLLLVLMSASTLWSSASWFTLRDSLTFLCLVVTAWLIAKNASLQAVIIGVLSAGIVVLAASGVLLLIDPMSALERSAGSLEYDALQGIYANRNLFGLVLLGCIPAALAVELRGRTALLWRVMLVGAFLGAIAASRSTTSLIIGVVVIAGAIALTLARRSRIWSLTMVGLAIIGVAVVALNWSQFLGLFGKNSTLTGRLEIWAGLIDVFREFPFLGAGFLREWPGGSAQAVAVAERMNGVHFAHGHNEVLSWLAGLGVVGLVIVLAAYASNYWSGWIVYRSRSVPGAAWLVLTMLMINGRGLTETSESSANGWFLFALVAFLGVRYLTVVRTRQVPLWIAISAPRRRDQVAAAEPIAM